MTASFYEKLFPIIDSQYGLFTTEQAQQMGISLQLISYFHKKGFINRIDHGIYRLVPYASHPLEDYMAAALKAGQEAVLSHDTALYVYEISRVIPDEFHVIIPRGYKRNRKGLKYHTSNLRSVEKTTFKNIPVTSLKRTLHDCIIQGVDFDILKEAIDKGHVQMLISKQDLIDLSQETHTSIRTFFNYLNEVESKPF